MRIFKQVVLSLFIVVCSCFSLLWADSPKDKTVFVISTISTDALETVKKFSPLGKYLEKKLRDSGVQKVKIQATRSAEEITRKLREGEVDLYIDSPIVSIAVNQGAGSKMIGRRWKKNTSEYHTIIFARKNRNEKEGKIDQVQDLEGKLVAFEEPFSTSGYYLPRIKLMETGISMKKIDFTSNERTKNKISYKFSNDDETTLLWVLQGRVDAGAFSNKKFKKYLKGREGDLKVVSKSISVPRHVLNLSPRVSPALSQKLKGILFEMHKDSEGRDVLKEFEKTRKFDEIPKGMQKNMDAIRPQVIRIMGQI